MYYTSDILMAIAQSVGVQVNSSFKDVVNPGKVDNRTGDEVAADVIKKLGLRFKDVSIQSDGQIDP